MGATVVSLDVDRPAGEVFEYVSDPGRFAEWQQDVVSAELLDPDPRRVGARYRTTRAVGPTGRRVTTTSEVVDSDPPRRWVARVADGPVRSVVTVGVQPLGDARCRVTVEVDYTGHGIGKLLVPLVVRRQSARQAPGNRLALRDRLAG